MPRKIITEKTVFKFEELSESAKETARNWWRQSDDGDTYWSESVIEDFEETLTTCGFSVEASRGSRSQSAIYWEGFSHQGSGASFNASWSASAVNVAALIADRPVSWKDEQGVTHNSDSNAKLVGILGRFQALADADREAYGNTSASHRGHSQSTEYNPNEESTDHVGNVERGTEFDSLCDDLAAYLYSSLETEYEYQNSDEQVDETIQINNYEFDEDGNRA